MQRENKPAGATESVAPSFSGFSNPWADYWVDAWQRSVLFLDVLRQRGNNYEEHNARQAPHVLAFEAELLIDGRKLERPVNYALVRIVPPAGVATDPRKRPFVVFDPRAGHGPGIGGMKHDSEIGVALKAGHPCYFVGFLPEPVPGQTIEDVCRAEAHFVEEVAARHPDAEGKPCLIGNCQAGWQIMMMAAIHPDLPGPIMLAGSPLSYWAGVHGKNPMRYLGGLLGGTWMTALAGDLGKGIFDGAHLVANFESLHPANTLWQKPYNLYSKIDTEAPRFLEFEKWWGSPVLLNAEEMQAIADQLFVGNKLSTGQLRSRDGVRVDLRNIQSPIIVFCSQGDDITPPQQALGWILDLYDHENEIVMAGQTIVYTLHQSIGHLGIFVSGKVATKEHGEFTQCMDMIDLMPPGLYEAVITTKDQNTENADLVQGQYLFRLEGRTLDDIRALGGNSPEDELRFETAARISAINLGLYQTLWAPLVRMMATEESAKQLRAAHPNRLRFGLFSDKNPFMPGIAALADAVRSHRRPVAENNPFLMAQQMASNWIVNGLEAWTKARDDLQENLFLNVYGHRPLQAAVGLGTEDATRLRHAERDLLREATEARAAAELEQRLDQGGPIEAAVRALLYVRLPDRSADERGFQAIKEIAPMLPTKDRVGLVRLKTIMREQFLILTLDQERAIAALPHLLPKDATERNMWLSALRRIATARGEPTGEVRRRLQQIEAVYAVKAPAEARKDSGKRELQTEETHGTGAKPAA
jgi:pimeloyl-ACP methyl ester carboxylesterase